MKYNININQLVLADTDLDVVDAAILDWIIVFCNSLSPKISSRRKNGHTQIDYQTLIDDMPLLRIKSKGCITPRIRRIEKAGYIQVRRELHQSNFIALTDKVDELFIKLNSSVQKTEQPYGGAVQKTEPIINTSIINTRSEKTAKAVSPFYKTYLDSVPLEDLRYFTGKYACTKDQVVAMAIRAKCHYEGIRGPKIKNYKAVLEKWIVKEHGLRKKDHLFVKDGKTADGKLVVW